MDTNDNPFSLIKYSQLQFDCLILAHPSISILEETYSQLKSLNLPEINLNKELSENLKNIPLEDRGQFTHTWMVDTFDNFKNSPVVCYHLDILFEPSLNLDPLTLFRQIAKFIPLIILWPGEYSLGTLTYAVPKHHHFRSWKTSHLLLSPPQTIILSL